MADPQIRFRHPKIYNSQPGRADLVYGAICAALANRAADWGRFDPADWDLLGHMAAPDREGVGGMLYRLFQENGWPAELPERTRAVLARIYYNNQALNQLLFEELARILAHFESIGIPVIVLKGAALAATVYDDPGVRPMGDLDLLVAPQDVRTAWKALAAIGYEMFSANTEIGLRKKSGADIAIDLHWCLVARFDSREDEIDWFSTGLIDFDLPMGKPAARTFTPELHLAYLGWHTFDSRPLRAFYDIHLLVERCEPDWDLTRRFLERAGWESTGGRMIRQAGLMFSGESWLPEIGDAGRTRPKPISRTRSIAASWRHLDLRTRVLVIAYILFPTRQYLERRYKRSIRFALPFWVLVRWADMGWDLARTAIAGRAPAEKA